MPQAEVEVVDALDDDVASVRPTMTLDIRLRVLKINTNSLIYLSIQNTTAGEGQWCSGTRAYLHALGIARAEMGEVAVYIALLIGAPARQRVGSLLHVRWDCIAKRGR